MVILCIFVVVFYKNKYIAKNQSIVESQSIVTNQSDEITEKKIEQFNYNVYYEEELLNKIDREGYDNEEIFMSYATLSSYLNIKYPGLSFLVHNFIYDEEYNYIYIKIYQIIDEAIIEDSYFSVNINLEDREVDELDYEEEPDLIFDNLDNTINISVDEIKEKSINLVKEYSSMIFSEGDPKEIYGEYYLIYDKNKRLNYKIIINKVNYITIDAVTGEITDMYFWNGIIE